MIKNSDSQKTLLEAKIIKSKTREECEELLNICDDLYNGIPVLGFMIEDLPPKEIYEKYAKHANHVNIYHRNRFEKIATFHKYVSSYTVNEIENCILYPNFDGVPVAIEFNKVNNLFIPVKAQIKNRDVTEKITHMIKYLEYTDEKIFRDVSKMTIIGVFICKERCIYDDGKPALDHYNISQNKINGSLEDFISDLNRFDFIGLETVKIIKDNVETILNQAKNLLLFQNLICVFNNYSHKLYNAIYSFCENTSDINFYKTYIDILENEEHPTNGIVYSSKSYVYNENFENNKFIWLPPKNKQIRVSAIKFDMTKLGLTFKIKGTSININDESDDMEFKIPTADLENLISSGLGVNAICSYDTNKNNIKFISSVLIESDKPYILPTYCPKCKQPLNITRINDVIKNIKCENANCNINLPNKWAKFLAIMFKFHKQNYEEPMLIYNEKGKEIKQMLRLEKIKTIAMSNPLNVNTIKMYVPKIFEEFDELELSDQLIALGIVNTKTQAEKLIEKENYDTISDVPDVWIYN